MGSNAERQRAYRERHLHDIEGQGERINTVISLPAKRSLGRLAACYGVTQRAMLERVIAASERELLAQLPHEQHTQYYDAELKNVTQ